MRLSLIVALLGASAFAQPTSALHPDQWVHTRAFATVGLTGRDATQTFSDQSVSRIPGLGVPAVFALHLSGAFFPRDWFGVGLEVRSDLVGVRQVSSNNVTYPQQVARAAPTAAFRWRPSLLLGLEGHLGWSLGRLALIQGAADGAPAMASFAAMTGPVAGLVITVDPLVRLSLVASARVEFSLVELSGYTVSGGLQARYGFLEVGPFDLGLALSAEVSHSQHSAPARVRATETLWRVGVGPSLVGRRAAPAEVKPLVEAPSVVGRVTRPDGEPVPGAAVKCGAVTATTDAAGAFSLMGLPPGPATVKAGARAFKPASKDIVVTPGTPVEVTLVLQPPSGPGRINGTVRAAPDKPLAGAKVVAGKETLTTSPTGTFTVERAGPGPVKVRVTLDGYAPADEVVQVAPEATATLEVTLEPVAQRTKAKIRGVISSASGPVAKATVRIVELKLKQVVKADGRFEADVAGGKYTLVIEAPQHVTQTRVVEVADGDQAIFQIELEKVR